jgi:hypothetical protein
MRVAFFWDISVRFDRDYEFEKNRGHGLADTPVPSCPAGTQRRVREVAPARRQGVPSASVAPGEGEYSFTSFSQKALPLIACPGEPGKL